MVLEINDQIWEAFAASVSDLQQFYKPSRIASAERPAQYSELSNKDCAAGIIQKSLVFTGTPPGVYVDSPLIALLTSAVRVARKQNPSAKEN
jgi:hypothetical protein